jgi:hypothetical protein
MPRCGGTVCWTRTWPTWTSGGVKGCHRADKLLEEIRARGYRGSARTLRRYTAPLREATAPPAPPAPAPKQVAAWILTPPGSLPADDRATLARITGRCGELAATRALVREFADMLCNRHGHKLPAWADTAETSNVRELRSFAAGLRKDWAAVTAGLTLPYSSGTVEGHVNRIKMIKRQMYGRANPDLLRKRVLLADCPPSRKVGQSHFLMATDTAWRSGCCIPVLYGSVGHGENSAAAREFSSRASLSGLVGLVTFGTCSEHGDGSSSNGWPPMADAA